MRLRIPRRRCQTPRRPVAIRRPGGSVATVELTRAPPASPRTGASTRASARRDKKYVPYVSVLLMLKAKVLLRGQFSPMLTS